MALSLKTKIMSRVQLQLIIYFVISCLLMTKLSEKKVNSLNACNLPVENTLSISWHGKPVSVVWKVAARKEIIRTKFTCAL